MWRPKKTSDYRAIIIIPTVGGCTEHTVTDRQTREGLKREWEIVLPNAHLKTCKLKGEHSKRAEQEPPTKRKLTFAIIDSGATN